MTFLLTRTIPLMVLLVGLCNNVFAQEDATLFVSRGNARVAKAQAYPNRWDGPVSGPVAPHKKFVVFIAADLRDKGAARVAEGVKEAAAAIDWNVQVVDCYGAPQRRSEAFSRALALKPDGIIFAGADSRNQTREMTAAAKVKVPVVGWHAGPKANGNEGLYTNIGTDAQEVGAVAALYGVVESKGRAGVIVFVDSSTGYGAAKAAAIADVIKRCQTCTLLGVEEAPLTETPAQFQQRVVGLSKKFGNRWTHMIGTNDRYFDLLAGPGTELNEVAARIQGVSAGDGSETAYQRIRNHNLQIATIPEPLKLQGWQLIDELNRAIAGVKPSGYSTPAYLVTGENLAFQSGQKNLFDPINGYRDEYRKIWTK